MTQHTHSSWLCAPGDYSTLTTKLTGSDPRLLKRDPKATRQGTPWQTALSQAVILQKPSNSQFSAPLAFSDGHSLAQFLQNDQLAQNPDTQQIIILQGLNPAFTAAVGSHFKMHPSFFVEHERVVVIPSRDFGEDDGPILPSSMTSRGHLTFKYYECFTMPESMTGIFNLCCADSGRHLGITRLAGEFSRIGMLRRKCSVWRRLRQGGTGWDVVLLTDPPFREAVRPSDSSHFRFHPTPIQGGYVDFTPHESQLQAYSAPPRTSMLDDLCFYITTHESLLQINTPDNLEMLVHKIIASHYMQHMVFISMAVSRWQWTMSRHNDIESWLSTSNTEAQWSDVQALARRIVEYCEDLESIMLQSGIPFEAPDTSQPRSWRDVTPDYQFLYARYTSLRARTESLNSSITALVGMAGNQHSLRETKRTRSLTIIGLMFLPLAFISSLFSMADDYLPGHAKFWHYFAVSLPLTVIIFIMYTVVDKLLPGIIS